MFDLEEINYRTAFDPKGLCIESENTYRENVQKAADMICDNLKNSRIVLLSGPSSSGKTTTASKIDEALESRGIKTEHISMDDYYQTVSDETTPKTADGAYDFESPLCLDSELLHKHIIELDEGMTVNVPQFIFSSRSRGPNTTPMKLSKDSVVIIEGIHALNDSYTNAVPDAFKLYIATKTDVGFKGDIVFDKTWFRLTRRTVRDAKFRGYNAAETLSNWENIRRGEKLYIEPNLSKVNFTFDTCYKSELPMLCKKAEKLIRACKATSEQYPILEKYLPATLLFGEISLKFVASDSLLREFVG